MKKLKTVICLLLALTILMVVVACGNGDEPKTTQSAQTGAQEEPGGDEKEPGDYKIILILPGPINDQSWNATNYAGLLESNETLGTNMEYVENVQASDYESSFREYGERGYDLIMAAGSQFDEAANNVAPSYPDSTFCVVNGTQADHDNVAPIFPREYEASYLAGIIAGHLSENGQFATIGGFPNKPMEDLLDVYEKTAVSIAKERGIENSSANRAYANSWDDLALGKQMAEQMIDNGADILFVYANQVGLGVIEGASEKNVTVVGFSDDQTKVDPETVTSSVLFDFRNFYTWALQEYFAGDLTGNQVHEAGINEGIFVPVYTEHIDQEVKDAVQTAVEEYGTGTVDLTELFES